MDPSKAHHQAIMANQILENAMACPKQQQERRLRPQPEQALNCPRCDSTNTKFCYYNNYSLSQPRYFCKACRRYWTKGGTLRNVPVGGGCRKNNKRSSSSKRAQEQPLITTNPNPVSSLPLLTYESNDLTLAFARLQRQSSGQLGLDDHDNSILGNPNSTTYTTHGFLDTLNGFQNYYDYGLGNGNIAESIGGSEEVLLPYNETGVTKTTPPLTTTIKHEFFSGRDGENKVLWGYPWQINEDGNMGGVDSGREYWNGHGASCYGILNSPLM